MDVLSYPSSLASAAQPQLYPYEPSISSSASSSSSSIFSVDCPSSQGSVSSFSSASVDGSWETGCASELRALASQCLQRRKVCGLRSVDVPVPPELRQNPRRTRSVGGNGSCTRPPPSLVRQCERKVNFVDSLVDSAAQIVESIWPLSVAAHRNDAAASCKTVLPLRIFIQETLRRSRTSYSTLQVALYYLILIKDRLPRIDFTMEQPREHAYPRAMQCGRRMFLAALILASKYLQDRNYSARAWSKISGLSTAEINQNEWSFLEAVDWKLHISEKVFQRWTDLVLRYTPNPGDGSSDAGLRWATVIPLLTPELDTVDMARYHRFRSPTRELFSTPSPCQTPVPAAERAATFGNDQTPTDPRQQLPTTLEPNPNVDYSNVRLPSLPKLGLLPTPQMTPQSNPANTPAVGVNGFEHCRPSIGVALHRAKSMSVQRSTLDQRPSCLYASRTHSFDSYAQCRRSSLARSSSSCSSPESMVSDVPSLTSSRSSRSSRSTRSSRSSSVSSTTSGASFQPRACVTSGSIRRCANLPLPTNCLKDSRKNLCIATPIDEALGTSDMDIYASPEPLSATAPSLPDLSTFSLGTPSDSSEVFASAAHEAAARGLCELSGVLPRSSSAASTACNSTATSPSRRCRKRGRTASSSEDSSRLHENVRHLMSFGGCSGNGRADEDDSSVVLTDSDVADSFLLNNISSKVSTMELPLRLSIPTHPGSMKRTCRGNDAAKYLWKMRSDASQINIADELD